MKSHNSLLPDSKIMNPLKSDKTKMSGRIFELHIKYYVNVTEETFWSHLEMSYQWLSQELPICRGLDSLTLSVPRKYIYIVIEKLWSVCFRIFSRMFSGRLQMMVEWKCEHITNTRVYDVLFMMYFFIMLMICNVNLDCN